MVKTHLLLYIYSHEPISAFWPLRNCRIDRTTFHPSSYLCDKALGEARGNLLELGLELLAESAFPVDLGKHVGLV
jgi:hypothetical protein